MRGRLDRKSKMCKVSKMKTNEPTDMLALLPESETETEM